MYRTSIKLNGFNAAIFGALTETSLLFQVKMNI